MGVVCVCVGVWKGGVLGVRKVGEEGEGREKERERDIPIVNNNSHQSTNATNMSTSVTGL